MVVKRKLTMAGMPLQMRIGLSVLAALVVGLGLFSWVGLQAVRAATNRILDERLNRARIAAELLDQNLLHLLTHLQTAASSLVDIDSVTQFRLVADSMTHTLRDADTHALEVVLTDVSGRVRQRWQSSARATSAEFWLNPEAIRVLSTQTLTISNAFPTEDKQVVLAAAPVIGAPGKVVGMLAVTVDVGDFATSSFGRAMRIGETGYAEVVDGNGVVLIRTQPASAPRAAEQSDHPQRFATMISEGKAAVGTCHRCHEEKQSVTRRQDVLAFAPLATASWGVALRQSEEEALAPVRQLEQRLLVLGAIILVAVALLIWGIMRSVVRPILMLTAATQRVAVGDFRPAVPARRRDEIGSLSAAFGNMTEELRRSREQLLSRNRELSVLNSIAATVGRSLDQDLILGNALERVLEVTGAASGCMLLPNGENGKLAARARAGDASFFDCGAAAGASCACYQVLRSGQIMRVNHGSQCPQLRSEGDDPCGFVAVPLKSGVRTLGIMNIGCPAHALTDNDFRLLESIGYYVGMAIENASLYAESRQKEELRGQLLGRVISAQEEERKRISRELHDEHGQTLTGLLMTMDKMETMISPQQGQLRSKMEKARSLLSRLLDNLRLLTAGLRPPDLDGLGLTAAISAYAEERLGAAGIDFDFSVDDFDAVLPPPMETALFRIVQEAINNVIRHAQARSVRVRLGVEKGTVRVVIEDDGHGFQPHLDGQNTEGTLGLLGIRERAELLGGNLSIRSSPGRGTRLTVEIPLPEPSVAAELRVGRPGG